MAASTSSWSLHEEGEGEEEEPNNKLQSLQNQSDSLILSCLRRKAKEDKNFLFWDLSPSSDSEENDVHEPASEVQIEPNRASPLVQITLNPNGYCMKLLVPSNGNNGRNGDSGNDEVFLPYEDSYNPETGLLEYLDAGLTPPALFDLLQLRFPERINQIECHYGQEVEVLVKDNRHINPTSSPYSSCKDSTLTIDTQFRLKSSDVTTMKVVRQKVVTLNHEKRRLNLNIIPEETSCSNVGKGKNPVQSDLDPTGSCGNEPKPKAKSKRKRKTTSAKNLDATREEIESQVIFDCSEPLCLDPSPIVCLIENRLTQASRFIQSSQELINFTRKNVIQSSREINKKMKLATKVKKEGSCVDEEYSDEFAPLNPAECLTNFLSKKANSRTPAAVRAFKKCRTMIGSGDYPLTSESIKMEIDKTFAEISKIASRKALASSLMNRNFTDNSLIKVEEYLMEFDIHQNLPPINAGNVQQQLAPPSHGMTAVSIFHRPIDDTFFGQLFVDRAGLSITDRSNWNEALRSNSSSRSCHFKLGSRENAKAYLEQFTEILSENGRKSVRITRSGVGAGIPQIQQQRQNPLPHQQQQQVPVQQSQQQLSQVQHQQPPQLAQSNVQSTHHQVQQQPHIQPSHQIPVGVASSTLPVAAKVQLQPIQAGNVQVIHPASMGTKVILPAPVQQIQHIPNNATMQQQQHHAAQMVPTPIAPAPPSTVQIKSQPNVMGNVSLCSLLQQPIQVVQNNTANQVPAAAVVATPVSVPNQIQPRPIDVQHPQLNPQQQQQLIQSLQQGSNQSHLTAALESQMRPGQSWIVLPPSNNLATKSVPNTGMITPVTGQTITAVPVSQNVNVNQGFRPFQVILWPQQQQQTVNVQSMIQTQHVPTSNGPVTMTLTQVQQQQIQSQIQQQINQQQQQQSHP